jgi:ribosomal protein S18 acetylase RimI-like enzyme
MNDDRVVGVMRMVEWPRCQMSPVEKLRMLPIILGGPIGATLRALKGRAVWSKHDPKEHHWHLDPLVVAPEMQGRGIGSQLLERFCQHVDRAKQAAYLETDKSENVRLYERFGFSVVEEAPAIGVHTWFMWRSPRHGES